MSVCVTSQNRTTLLKNLEETVNSDIVGYDLVYITVLSFSLHTKVEQNVTPVDIVNLDILISRIPF